MRRTRFLHVLLAMAVAVPTVVSAQANRNTREAAQDETQIAVDKVQIARDVREIDEFRSNLSKLEAARYAGRIETYLMLNARLRDAMEREVAQARRKVSQAAHEVDQSRRERRGERQEATATGDAHDYAQLRDDRRDLRDDRLDRAGARKRAERMAAVIVEGDALHVGLVEHKDQAPFEKNLSLMEEFLELMRADLAASQAELREDRRERREDRRERQSDRRK